MLGNTAQHQINPTGPDADIRGAPISSPEYPLAVYAENFAPYITQLSNANDHTHDPIMAAVPGNDVYGNQPGYSDFPQNVLTQDSVAAFTRYHGIDNYTTNSLTAAAPEDDIPSIQYTYGGMAGEFYGQDPTSYFKQPNSSDNDQHYRATIANSEENFQIGTAAPGDYIYCPRSLIGNNAGILNQQIPTQYLSQPDNATDAPQTTPALGLDHA